MAKDLNRSIKIYIDHSDAMKKASDFKNKISEVNQKLAELNAQGKKDSAEAKAYEKTLRQLTAQYDRYQERLAKTERVLKNLSGATRGELLQVQKELRASMKDLDRKSKEYKSSLQALIAVEKQLNIIKKEQNGALGRNATLWSRMADGFNKYFGIATSVIAGITGLSFVFRKLAEDVAQMDDVYSDVMKTTNLTREQVVDLNEDFKKMDTRTAREELNRLARDAGKLGIEGANNVLDFVEAGNQINVALGDDLGEGAIKNIGKMTDVYARSTKELEQLDLKGKMLAIGSAINELGMSSTASEKYMVNFAQRLGGVASQAGISIQNILGYASALDQSGQAVEMSATALQKFIMKLMDEPTKFAKLAGLEIKAFNELLQKDTNAAIKQVLTALSDKGGFQALIPIFKDMGLDGARAVGVLSALATNIEKVNTAQEISNKAFEEGTSITNEYSIKNTNLNAQLEKARKTFKDAALEVGESLNPVLLKSTKWTTHLIKTIPSIINFFEKYGKVLLYLSVVGGIYLAGVKLQVLWNTKLASALTLANIQLAIKNTWLKTLRITVLAYNAVMALFTGNITRAAAAWKMLNASMKASLWGVILAAITAVGIALYNLYKRKTQQIDINKKLRESESRYNAELASELGKVKELFDAYKKTNPQSEEHKRIREVIISKYGKYIQHLIDEKGHITDIGEALRIVNQRLREQIALKIRDSAVEEIRTEALETYTGIVDKVMDKVSDQIKNSDVQKEIRKSLNTMLSDIQETTAYEVDDMSGRINNMLRGFGVDTNKDGGFFGNSVDNYVSKLLFKVKDTNKAIGEIKDKYDGMFDEMLNVSNLIKDNVIDDDNNDTTFTPPEDPDKNLAAKQKKELNLILEALETKHQEKLLEIKMKFQNGDIKSESEYNSKVFAQNQAYYILQEQALTEYLKKVSDKTLKSDITKQIADIRVKQLDEAIKQQKKLDQIILDANPEEKEKRAYENRLRDLQLFGTSKEALLLEMGIAETEEEKKLLQKKYAAFVLLEQEHQDNLVKIRKAAKSKQKAAAEEIFEEEFAERKAKLQQEIADETQRVELLTGIGVLTGESAFNAEVALQQKKIALIQEEVEARKKAGLDISKTMQKYQSEEIALTKLYVAEYNRRTQLCNQYGESVGSALGNVLIGQENALRDFGGVILDILFDVLSKVIDAKIAEATAVAIAEQAKAAAIAAAMPDSVATFGAAAAARTAVISGIIMAALAAAKSALKGMISKGGSSGSAKSSSSVTTGERVVTQRAAGKYDVIGQDDGKLYENIPYIDNVKSGIVHHPTLISENGGELIVSSPDLKALQKHMNYPLIVNAIQDVRSGRVPQRAAGKYDQINDILKNKKPDDDLLPAIFKMIESLLLLLKDLRDNPIQADLNIHTFEKKKSVYDDIKKTTSKS